MKNSDFRDVASLVIIAELLRLPISTFYVQQHKIEIG